MEKNINYEMLANDLVDYLCETEGVKETIKLLLEIDYTVKELQELNFELGDIKAVQEEIS